MTMKAGTSTGLLPFTRITRLEDKLKAVTILKSESQEDSNWELVVKLFYEQQPVGVISFTLRGYCLEEAEYMAGHIKDHPHLMREIDEFLWGESD